MRKCASSPASVCAYYAHAPLLPAGVKLFIEGKLVAAEPCAGGGAMHAGDADLVFGADSLGRRADGLWAGAHDVADGLHGALEEIYLKNASCENRHACARELTSTRMNSSRPL